MYFLQASRHVGNSSLFNNLGTSITPKNETNKFNDANFTVNVLSIELLQCKDAYVSSSENLI